MFVKMHQEPIQNGLLTQVGESWGVLCALAIYANKEGECYPTQDEIAGLVGVSRKTVNKRIGELCNVQYNGKPVLSKRAVRYKGEFTNNVYTINKEVLSIFS